MNEFLTIRQVYELRENEKVKISMNGKVETYLYKDTFGYGHSRQFYFQNEHGDSLGLENSDFEDIELKLIIQRA